MTRTITAIQPSTRDPNMREVYVDHSLATTMPLSLVELLHIEVNQQWTDTLVNHISRHNETVEARRIALDLISRRSWGINELATRLVKRGVNQAIATETTDKLAEDGWLDDVVYAGALIRQWLRKEPAGRKWLRHKLMEKEIPTEIVDAAIGDELGDLSEQDSATALALIKISKASALDDVTRRRRVIYALARRGFTMDEASEAYRCAQDNCA